VDEGRDLRQVLNVLVAVDAKVLRADSAGGFDRRRLGEDEPRASDRTAPEMDQVPLVREPVGARILAHRRDDDAIAHGHAPQRERLEQCSHDDSKRQYERLSFTSVTSEAIRTDWYRQFS